MKRITISAFLLSLLLLSVPAVAQEDLTKEITVETDYTPHERKASKLNLLPAVSKPDVKPRNIGYSEWSVPADVPALAPLMMPYGYRTTHEFSHSRGYADFGIGSYANIAANAGYAIIAKPTTVLNLWAQHNSTWSGRNRSENLPEALDEPQKQKFNNNIIGIDFSRRFHRGTLTASAMCHFDHFNYYGGYNSNVYTSTPDGGATVYDTNGWNESDSMQSVKEFRVALGWRNNPGNADTFKYSAALDFSHFGLSKAVNATINNKGIADNRFALSLSGETLYRGSLNYGADVKFQYLGRSFQDLIVLSGNAPTEEQLKHTDGMGLLTLAPFVRYASGKFNARAGVNVNISMSDGTAFRIAPNIRLNYAMCDGAAVELKATGGKSITTLSDIYAHNRYVSPIAPLSNPFVPLDAELALRVGPFTGFHARVFAGYGIFKSMPLPTINGADKFHTFCTLYEPYDIKGWKAGAEVGYRYRSLVDARLSLTYSPQDLDKGYFLGFDRAKCIADFSLTVTPIEKLKVNLGYELRAKRTTPCVVVVAGSSPDVPENITTELCDLGTVSNLSLGASYQATKMLGVFVSGSNLLGKKWDNYYNMGAQGFTFMAGASVVF